MIERLSRRLRSRMDSIAKFSACTNMKAARSTGSISAQPGAEQPVTTSTECHIAGALPSVYRFFHFTWPIEAISC